MRPHTFQTLESVNLDLFVPPSHHLPSCVLDNIKAAFILNIIVGESRTFCSTFTSPARSSYHSVLVLHTLCVAETIKDTFAVPAVEPLDQLTGQTQSNIIESVKSNKN